MAADHELAARTSVSVEMLADFAHATSVPLPDYWEDAYLPFRSPRGRVIERGHLVTTLDEVMHLVAVGEIVQPFPVHVTDYWAMPDVQWRPIADLPRLPYALIWRADAETDAIRALAEVARDLGPILR
jgi:hypothetical protein